MSHNSYLRKTAEELHKQLGHNLDGGLYHEDRVYNSIQCLCYWGMHGTLDGHESWAPVTPHQAATEVIKGVRKLSGKGHAVSLLNTLSEAANNQKPELKQAKVYEVKTKQTETGHSVDTIASKRAVAPAIMAETVKKEEPKQLTAGKKPSKKKATVVQTIS